MIFVLQGLAETINRNDLCYIGGGCPCVSFSENDVQLNLCRAATTDQSRKLARDGTVSGSWGHPNGLDRNCFSQGTLCQIGIIPLAPSCNSGCSDNHLQILETSPENWKIMGSKKVKPILLTNKNSGIPTQMRPEITLRGAWTLALLPLGRNNGVPGRFPPQKLGPLRGCKSGPQKQSFSRGGYTNQNRHGTTIRCAF